MIWKTPISLDSIRKRNQNTLVDTLAIEFTKIGDNFLTARMPVNEKTRQPLGIMHGGASCVLAETIGSTAANYVIDSQLQFCVGLSIYTSHIRSVRDGFVVGTATPLHLGRSTQVWNIDIKDEQESLISSTRLTMAVLNKESSTKS
jgi:1,4-dihydroxy-2-naphthoyl-CoA hydrolase